MKDPYQILGVARTATAEEIKAAYRKLARSLHPDLNPNDKVAESRFKEITAAYDLLSDATRKGRFDRGEIDADGNQKRPGRAGRRREGFGADFDDILSDLLRRREKARQKFGTGPKARGADANYAIKVGFIDAAIGVTKRLNLPDGRVLDVRIPPGTADGQTLRLKGQGHPAPPAGQAGDALVEVAVEERPLFERREKDVLIEIPVSLQEAILGAKITIPTIAGRVAVTVPPNSNTGTVLRLKGKGIPDPGGPGDQLVSLTVVLPDRPDAELEQFVRKWAAKNVYDPRVKAGIG